MTTHCYYIEILQAYSVLYEPNVATYIILFHFLISDLNEKFLLLQQCFQLCFIIYTLIYWEVDFYSHFKVFCCRSVICGKGLLLWGYLNMKQPTLKTLEYLNKCKYYELLNKIENIVAKGEIAHLEQFLLLLQGFQKSSVACRGVRKCLYVGKG